MTNPMAETIPRKKRLSRNIIQHPALARIDSRLVDSVSQHVVVIGQHLPPERVGHGVLVALNIEFQESPVMLFDRQPTTRLRAVVSDGEKGAPQRVEERGCRRAPVQTGLLRGILLVGRAGNAPAVPGGEIIGVWKPRE